MPEKQPGDFTLAVIDDDPGTLDVMERFFTHYGFRIVSAPDGRRGLEAMAATTVDLVLLDVMMPGMDGYEVAHHIQQQWPLMPIIMLTAKVEQHDRLRGLMTGAHRYLSKPCSPMKVLEEVAKLLGLPGVPSPNQSGDPIDDTAHDQPTPFSGYPDPPPPTV